MARPNLLITSVSQKVPLVKAAMDALTRFGGGKVIGGDVNPFCVASYFVEGFWKMAPLAEMNVNPFITECKAREIVFVVPTRDGELPIFAAWKDQLEKAGIFVMISSESAITTCRDKLKFYEALSTFGFKTPKTALDVTTLSTENLVVKERFGAGSRGIGLNLSRDEAASFARGLQHPLFQEFIPGMESSLDLYVDKSGKCRGVISRSRDVVLNGESQVTTTYENKEIEAEVARLAMRLALRGHALIQMIDGVVIECNPRIGGASTLSFKAGLDSLYWWMSECFKKELQPFKKNETVKRLVRYPEDWML